jgi:hypothetical protein
LCSLLVALSACPPDGPRGSGTPRGHIGVI